jgi:nucleotide-binding universal stress UspA family protein
MKTILAPVDFSSVSDAVIDAALLLARATQARIVILSVVQPPIITSDYGPMLENIGEIISINEKSVSRRLAALAKRLRTPSLPVETVRVTGAPAALILEQAKKSDADYIVIGSHGHTALYDLLVGSTAHQVLRKASCPVMIVPPPIKKAAHRKTK